MILSISYQLKIFLISLCIGLILGFLYDFLKIFRKYVLHNNFFINIEDIIYWLFMSIIIFLITLFQNNGQIRAFFILGIFISMLLYNLLISPIFLKLSTKIINFILKIFLFIFKVIYIPILTVFNTFFKPVKFIFNLLKKLLQNCKFYVTIYNKINSIKLCLKYLKGGKTKK